MNLPKPPQAAVPVWKLWSAALFLAGCETWFNFAATPGLNWLLSTLAASGFFVAFLRLAVKPLTWQRLLPLTLACVLSGGAAITANPLMETLILIGVLGLLAAGLLIATSPSSPAQFGVGELLLAPLIAGVNIVRETARRIGEGARSARGESNLPVIRGIALAFPVTVVFSLLLSDADPILASWRDSIVQALRDFSFLGRTACFAAFGTLAIGSLGSALAPASRLYVPQQSLSTRGAALGSTERLIVLGAVTALLALFFLLELSHLFGNPAGIHGNGVTYSQLAHQGFAELTLVASLCAALLIALTRSTPSRRLTSAERAMSAVVIAQAMLLLGSAFHRLLLYEDAYGFTELRLFVKCYIGVVCLGLLELAAEILRSADFDRLARRWAVTALVALTILGYWNYAAWIARANFHRYERTGLLDIQYIVASLGQDAAPEVIDYLPRLPDPMQSWARSCLRAEYASPPDDNTLQPAWYEWSYRRAALESALRRSRIMENPKASASWSATLNPCLR